MARSRSPAEWMDVFEGIRHGHIPVSHHGVSGKARTYAEGLELLAMFPTTPAEGSVVFDMGCGNGRFAVATIPYGVRYLGIDPIPECVEFCREAFAPWPDYRFEHADLRNSLYNPAGSVNPAVWRFPAEDASVDWAVAVSVFTHLETLDVAAHYVSEFRRILKPGGTFFSTWFRDPPNKSTADANRTVFREVDILNLLGGMEWLATRDGLGTEQHDQWRIWTRKPCIK